VNYLDTMTRSCLFFTFVWVCVSYFVAKIYI